MTASELIKKYSIRLAKEWNNNTQRMEPTGMLYLGNAQSARLQHVDAFGHYYTVKNFFEFQKNFQ